MEGVGTFSKKFSFIGGLEGSAITNGAEFIVPQTDGIPLWYPAYIGNRVNLYIYDRIVSVNRLLPGATIGMVIAWTFSSAVVEEPNRNCELREVDWNGDPPPHTWGLPLHFAWGETKVEFADAEPRSDGDGLMGGLQLGELDYYVYRLPRRRTPLSGGAALPDTYRVLPVVARGDFMRVWFWSDPTNWTGHDDVDINLRDRIAVFAMSGADVSGSQVIGGGHG